MIEHLQDALDKAPSAPIADDANIYAINLSLLQAYRSEEEFWKQRSRQLWLSLGDKNTGYFHAATKGRKARNRLSVIEDQNGDVLYEEEQIVECIGKYFTEIFTSSNRDCTSTVNQALTQKITPEMNEQLIKLPTAAEIKAEMFSIHPDKAHGPDGFSASFFQSNWETIGPAITHEI